MLTSWMHRGGWFRLACPPGQAAPVVIAALERYSGHSGAWQAVDPGLRTASRSGMQEPVDEVSAMLGPTLVGPMPRDSLFVLRTYDAGDGGSAVLLTVLVTNPLKVLKTDRFLRRVLTDLAARQAAPIDRPPHLRV